MFGVRFNGYIGREFLVSVYLVDCCCLLFLVLVFSFGSYVGDMIGFFVGGSYIDLVLVGVN